MSEKPILFYGEMVRAILEGCKTQTRRIVKPQPDKCGLVRELVTGRWYGRFSCGKEYRAPYNEGDILYVRETFRPAWTEELADAVQYRADNVVRPVDVENTAEGSQHHRFNLAFQWGEKCECAYNDNGENIARWIPSIHMPKWAARIWLKVTKIRPQALRDISERDEIAEGVRWCENVIPTDPRFVTPRGAFERVWKSCYGKQSWKSNPWVWVIEFERVEK